MTLTMRYRAVIFDLFGTLVPSFPSSVFENALLEMAQAVALDYADFQRLWKKETWQARATGTFPTIEANIHYICTTLGVIPAPEQLAQAARIRYEFTRTILHPRKEAVETLKHLRKLGLAQALISDCSAEVPELWSKTPLAAWIDVPIFSCEVKLKKPSPKIYHLACEGLRVEPKDCLYVGDGFSQELSGATQVGMDAVLIAPATEVSADVSETEQVTWSGKRIQSLAELGPLLQNHRG